jgi:predicted phosphodiesterase
LEKLAAVYQDDPDEAPAVAQKMGLNTRPSSVKRDIRNYIAYRRRFKGEIIDSFKVPETLPAYNEFAVVEAEDAVVISDLEIPDQDGLMLKRALAVAVQRGIKTLIYNGDIVATDQEALNSWIKDWKDGREGTFAETIRITHDLMLDYGKWFEQQYFVSGNHDNRIARKTGGEVWLEMFLRDTPTKFSRYAYMYLKNSRGWTKIIHPENYSINAASKLGVELWANSISPEGTKCHIVIGHTHLAQTAWSPDSQQEIVSTGCIRRRAQYKDTRATNNREWQRGFLVIQNGYFYPMTECGTDWQKEIGDVS